MQLWNYFSKVHAAIVQPSARLIHLLDYLVYVLELFFGSLEITKLIELVRYAIMIYSFLSV